MAKTLRDELKMTRPFKSVEEEAVLSIARTAALLEHAGAEALKPFDLTITVQRPADSAWRRRHRPVPERCGGAAGDEGAGRHATSGPDGTRAA